MELFLDEPLFSTLNQMLSLPDDMEKLLNVPTRTYVVDTKTMASTPVDIKEYPNSYVFVVDMPGLKSEDVRVQVEDKVLTISGERKREENEDTEAKYIRKERRVRRFMRKFPLPDTADIDSISAVCQDGVLTVTVPKVQPPETKKPKTIEVKAVDSEGAAARTQETPEVKGGESRD